MTVVRWLTVFTVVAVGAALLPTTVGAAPVASDGGQYAACGRVFPDPHAYWPSPSQSPGQSPWAKGNGSCRAVDFMGWEETLAGLDFLASDEMFSDFVEVYNLSGEDDSLEFTVDGAFDDVLDQAAGEGMTAGLPTEDLGREQVPMYLVRVTDEEDTTVPIPDRQHFAYALSIHGIERAGVEGGIRAIEDLATWGSCEKHGDENSPANCAQEEAGPDNPHPILETLPEQSTTAGEALRQQSVWFLLSNPDGWRRGDKQDGGFFYQRYNGNGVDMNRDWPTKGYTFRPYTPWSEPETRAVGKALQSVKDKWTGGIDLHGQLNAAAFSFTLIGGAERPFDKDRRVLQFTKGAWADAEERLAWSTSIKPNDAPPQPSDPRMYGVQWGTIWDTINYTVTGALGDWMDSPLGLDADGIDNEMSFSHLSNCGVGTCFINEFEQLHVDGNKSLIYAQMHYSLIDEDTTFAYRGRAAYLHNPDRISHAGSEQSTAPSFTQLPPQEPISTVINHVGDESTFEFDVEGPDQGVYNGGIRAVVTWNNATGVAAGSLNEIAIDRYRPEEEDPDRGEEDDEEWQTVNSYFNQAPTYAQGGAQLDANLPLPGRYRIRVTGVAASQFDVDITFLGEQAWPDPGQRPYDVSNMDFFTMLQDHVAAPSQLVSVPVADVLSGSADLSGFDTVIVADDAFLPGFVEPREATPAQEPVSGTVTVPGPGAGARSGATSTYFEFDVEQPQGALEATVTSDTVVDPDLYLQRETEDGWSDDLAAGETGRTGLETLTYSDVQPGHYRLEVHNWAGAPGPADVEIVFSGIEARVNDSGFTQADRTRMSEIARSFAEGGGNLVLTDNSLRALEWMGVVDAGTVAEQKVYAGHVQFSDDQGDSDTYDDPLAANVDQPGAAEGAGHRHQVAEPVPTGYAIQDPGGGDLSTHPQWAVDREAYEGAGGRVVGVVGDDAVTLGEIPMEDGVVRILGSLLPQPTEEYDHPYGLGSYGVTYSGYEVFRNMLDWTRPINRGCDPGTVPDSGFTDTAGNTHEANIECIAWYGITVGTSRTQYSPSRAITRDQMASFIARLAVEGGLELPDNPPDAFTDDEGNVHESNINALAEMGLVEGVGGRSYDPSGKVTRAQMASFIARVHEATTGSLPEGEDRFPDDDGNVHEDNINALAELGVVRGRDGRYFPGQSVTRAQMASFVMHDLGLQIVAEVAYFGGAEVTLASPEASEGSVNGTVKTNKTLESLVADGCGLENQSVEVSDDGSFTVELGEDESGPCQLALTATTRRPTTTGTTQTVSYEFTITVA